MSPGDIDLAAMQASGWVEASQPRIHDGIPSVWGDPGPAPRHSGLTKAGNPVPSTSRACFMKIMFYSQHVLGIGHFFRSMEFASALANHEVLFVEGGDALPGYLSPPHVRRLPLPGLMMDQDFKAIHAIEGTVGETRARRKQLLLDTFLSFRPDVLITELFPFGRKQFRYELMPLLELIRQQGMSTRVICSLRDILVEKADQDAYEKGVLEILNTHYHHLMVHSDPRIMRLDETFSRIDEIAIPTSYTGFIARKPGRRRRPPRRRTIVVSTGGGKVGVDFLESALTAFRLLPELDAGLRVFIGPFMDMADRNVLASLAARDSRTSIEEFAYDFLDCMAESSLSISMAGYNTCMDILSAAVPALVYPFPQNREQMLRARKLEELGFLKVLDGLDPHEMASAVAAAMAPRKLRCETMPPDLAGAANAALLVEKCLG